MKNFKRLVSILLCIASVTLLGQVVSADDTNINSEIEETLNSKHKLRFSEDGDFRVLVFSDTHRSNDGISDAMNERINTLVDRENPDLIILCGDNMFHKSVTDKETFREVMWDIVDYFEEKQIPWMHVYGNHDDEYGLSKEDQQEVYESFDYCISKDVEELTGVGNYVHAVYGSNDDEMKFAVWALDSGSYIWNGPEANHPGGDPYFTNSAYDYIRPDQVEWYKETSKQIQEYNDGEVVPGLMAFHIPLQESYLAYVENNKDSLIDGMFFEGESSCGAHNAGLFDAILERGDVKAIINGHDHENTFAVKYKDIILSQAGTVSDTTYFTEDLYGARVFVVNEEEPNNVETYFSYYDQTPKVWRDYYSAKFIPWGTKVDFEGETKLTATSYNGVVSESAKIEEITAEVQDGVGLDGSNGLVVKRSAYNSTTHGNNIEIKFDLEQYGKLGTNKYVMVHMDLATNDVDFRKACLGLTVMKEEDSYRTDDYDHKSPFYYMADGSTEWVEMSHGGDGCFGEDQDSSVRGLKGWFAFPTKYMQKGNEKLNKSSVVTGFYFYASYASADYANREFYLDNFMLIEDYRSLGKPAEHTHGFDLNRFDENYHWTECSCGNIKGLETHKGGEATKEEQAICEVCGESYGELAKDTCFDFEGETILTATSYNGVVSENAKIEEITAEVRNGVGIDGSKGLVVKRLAYNDTTHGNNVEIKINLTKSQKLGDVKYVMLWIDLATNDVDFRNACLGLVIDNEDSYRTDDFDQKSPFYYMADGSTSWVEMSHGGDGCFGNAQEGSVRGLKGWFAFPVEYMQLGSNKLNSESNVTGIYLYASYASAEYVNREYYFDNITLVEDYNEYTEANHQHKYEIKYDENNHWHGCACGEAFELEEHFGGQATTTEKAICEVCGQSYGGLAPEIVEGIGCDFETETVITATSYNGNTAEFTKCEEITAEIRDGVGVDGSKGLVVKRSAYNDHNDANNIEVTFNLTESVVLGNKKYLMVWIDLGTNKVDFRKACAGLLVNNEVNSYRTDDYDYKSPFYYLADGATSWVEMSHGGDGCFGVKQEGSVEGLKGWFAFPVEYMQQGSTKLSETSIVTGFYFYASYASADYANREFYFDKFMLVENYLKSEDSHEHEYELEYDETNHWHECVCGDIQELEEHFGGQATTTEKAICEVCGQGYGQLVREEADPIIYDFETETIITATSYNGNTAEFTKCEEITAEVKDGVGLDGSKGLVVKRSAYNDHNDANNIEITFNLAENVELGSYKYVMVWLDLSTNDVDFRKACAGLIVNNEEDSYRTDDYDVKSPFYYLADGATSWVEMSHGGDGCFGNAQEGSVRGLKGWFAFPTEYMQQGSTKLNETSVVTGFYFYASYASADYANREFYFDNFMLVEDYNIF